MLYFLANLQSGNDLVVQDGFFQNLIQIRFPDVTVPDSGRINDNGRSVLTMAQTARAIDAIPFVQPFFFETLF